MLPFLCVGSPSNPPSINISLGSTAHFTFSAYEVDIYDCSRTALHWKILRADGEAELYTVLDGVDYNYVDEFYSGSGLVFGGNCGRDWEALPYLYPNLYLDYKCLYHGYCDLRATVRPTDMTYNGAQITAVLDMPECFNSSNSSGVMTLNIQGQLCTNIICFSCI